MTGLRTEDHDMHYEDGSHRWTPPTPVDAEVDAAWHDRVAAHQAEHRRCELGDGVRVPAARRSVA